MKISEEISRMVRARSLVENTAEKAGLLGEHGLSIWIEIGDFRVLFDTGQGLALNNNARELGVALERTDAIGLSHGHYDHTGGLAYALEQAPGANVYLHPDALLQRYACDKYGNARDVGIRDKDRNALLRSGVKICHTANPTEIANGLYATGAVPREVDFEKGNGSFYLDEDCRRPDNLYDDQALFIDTQEGVVVFLGCAHAGVINTLNYVRRLTNDRPIHAVIGGMHLRGASADRIEATIDAMKSMNIEKLFPAHCTGSKAVSMMMGRLPDRCGTWPVGAEIVFHR